MSRKVEKYILEQAAQPAKLRSVAFKTNSKSTAQDAEDAAQDALLQAWKNRKRFRGDAKPGTWLHRIAVNCTLMRCRRKVFERLPESAETVFFESDYADYGFEQRVHTNLMLQQMYNEIETLPYCYRRTLHLYLAGLTMEEIAERTGWASGTVKAYLHRGKAKLRKLYTEKLPCKGNHLSPATGLLRHSALSQAKAHEDLSCAKTGRKSATYSLTKMGNDGPSANLRSCTDSKTNAK